MISKIYCIKCILIKLKFVLIITTLFLKFSSLTSFYKMTSLLPLKTLPPISRPTLITTAISYANGSPHVGHLYECYLGDVTKRILVVRGDDVKLLSGSDEHGKKIQQAAESAQITPRELCDINSDKFKRLHDTLGVSCDRFIRTAADADHRALVQDSLLRSQGAFDIYKDAYKGFYNVREETFVSETDAALTDFKDPVNQVPYEIVEQEAYLFLLSKYQDKIKDICEKTVVQKKALLASVQDRLDDLKDLCITRPKTDFTWGIDFVLDDNHIVYVWFDALLNYITGRNSLFPSIDDVDTIHIIGKDIVWFHAVIYPAILESCGYPLFNTILVHGHVVDEKGQKLSKSLGNVIDPNELFAAYPVDAVRFYFFLEHNHNGDDLKFSRERLVLLHNTVLINQFGNLFQRVYKIVNGVVDLINAANDGDGDGDETCRCVISECVDAFKNGGYNLNKYRDTVFSFIQNVNAFISNERVWEKNAEGLPKVPELAKCIRDLYVILFLLKPVIPDKIEFLALQFGWKLDNVYNSSCKIVDYKLNKKFRAFSHI